MNREVLGVLESPYIKLEVSNNGSYQILDKQTKVTWHSNPYIRRFCSATVRVKWRSFHLSLDRLEISKIEKTLRMTYRSAEEEVELTVNVELLDDGRTLELSYEPSEGSDIENFRLLDDGFWITDAEKGYVVVSAREGLMIPSDSGCVFIRRFPTFSYESCDMEMLGLVKNRSAVLIMWHDPYVTVEIKSTLYPCVADARQILSTSFDLTKTAKVVKIKFLGEGDYVTIAKAYREVAKEKGWMVAWREKLRETPEAVKLFGASNFKLWYCLDRLLDYKTNEKSVTVNWTFDEVAQVAEHLKKDVRIERGLFTIGGWIRSGYDNQHPDILPAAPECGGDEALAKASEAVKKLGYLFCLHDNYQDLYWNSPSWSRDLVMKREDGSLASGGFWSGGQAWLMCSEKGLELAKRPQNLPKVQELFNPNAYYIDTTFASGLCECYDKNHPLTKWEDMRYKQELCDYAISVFGVFGSECGKEWAVPHAYFFEGLGGVSGRYYHWLDPSSMGGRVIPLFEMVYRDCIAVYGKYGYDYAKSAQYVLHHIIIGRPLHYHSWEETIGERPLLSHSAGSGLYWKKTPEDEPQGWPYDASCFIRADNGWAEGMCLVDRFIKNTHEILSPLHEITAETVVTGHEFLTLTVEHVVFGEDVEAVVNKASAEFAEWTYKYAEYVHTSKMGGDVLLPTFGFVIESPTFVAFHALSWNGVEYGKPVLFTIRSLDGKPLEKSKKIRVFHGFGDSKLKLRGKTHTITREEILEF
jgi:hypothetical protein